MRDEVREFKRERVLEEATKLFFERGFQGASIDAIAERLGVTKPFIYTYFDNKHAILEEIYQRATFDLIDTVRKIFESDASPDAQLSRFVEFYVRRNIESREISAIFLNEERNLHADKLEAIKAQQRIVDHDLAAMIERGIKSGAFQIEDSFLASMAISGMVRWVHRWYNPGGRLGPDQLCHSLAQLALNVVRYTPSGKPSSTRTRRKKTDPGVSVERPGS